MAKKNGEFGIDDDFNFDDFNFDDSIPGMKPAKDNRKAITEVAGSFLGSVKDTVTSEPFVRRMVTESLPEGYGKAINTSYEALGTLRELYDSGVREFKPADTALRNIADKLTPAAKKILPKKLVDKLEGYAKGGTSGYQTPSKGEMDERAITESLADIFKTQAAADFQKGAYDEAKEQIRDSIEDKKFNLGFKEQQTVRQGIQRLVAYQDQVTAQYQKKSLELQYRQFFALRDISEVVRHESRISNEFLKAIAHNSALPDIVKSKFREVGKALFEERLAAGATNMVNRYVGQFMPNLRKRVLMTGRNLVSGFARGITEAHSAVDMASSMGLSGSEMGGSIAGGYAADELGYQGSKWVRGKVGNMDRVKTFGRFLDNRFSGIPEKANEWARTQSTRGGFLGWLENLAKATVGTYSPDYTASRSPLTALDQATSFNNQTQRSITEIIPGYLARIFREISWLRTGNDPGMTIYNYDRGTFTSDKQVQSDIKTRILHPTNVAAFQYSAGKMMDTHDPMRTLSKKQRELFQHQLLMDAESGLPYDPSRYLRPGFRISGASAMDNEAIMKQIRSHFKVADGSNKINLKDGEAAERLHQGRQMWEEARRRYPSPTDMIRVYAETGHLDQLHNMGFVVRNGLESRVNPEEIYRHLTGEMNDYVNPPPRDYPPGAAGAGGSQVPPMGPKGPEPPKSYAKRRPKPNEPSGGGAATVEEAKKTVYERLQKPRKGKKGKRYSVSSSLSEYPIDAHGNVIDPQTGQPIHEEEPTESTGPKDKIEELFRKQQERINRIKEDISRMSARAGSPSAQPNMSHIPPSQRAEAAGPGAEVFETMADRIARAVEMSSQRVIDTLESGKLMQESAEQTQTQQSIEKMVRAMLRRMLGDHKRGALDDGDAHFDEEYDDLPLGNSPEARLARALMKARRKAGAGYRWAKGKVTSGFGALRSRGKAFWASGNTVFGKAWQWGKDTLQDIHDRTIDMAQDLYVKGMNHPILEKAKLMAGEYYDEAGNVIRRWSDIKGTIYDKAGNVVVDAKDIARGFYDKHGKRILNSVTSRVGAAFWKLASLWSPTRWINNARNAGRRAVNWMRDLVDQPMDIYVRGENMPRMKAVVMAAGGYFSDRTGEPIKKPSQIDGIVRDDKGNIVIDLEDIKKGLVNAFGIPVGSLSTVVKRIVSGAFRRVKDAVTKTAKWAIEKGTALGKGAWNVAKNTFHGVTGFLKHGVGFFGAHPEMIKKQTDILQKIYDLLDDRLPNRRPRLGSYEQELKNEHAFASNDDNKKKAGDNPLNSVKNFFSKMGDWLKSKLEGDHDDDDDGHSNNTFYGGGEDHARDAKGRKRGGWSRNREAAKIRKLRKMGKSSKEIEEILAKKGLFSRGWGAVKGTVGGAAGGLLKGRAGKWANILKGGLKGLGISALTGYVSDKLSGYHKHHKNTVAGEAAGAADKGMQLYGDYQAVKTGSQIAQKGYQLVRGAQTATELGEVAADATFAGEGAAAAGAEALGGAAAGEGILAGLAALVSAPVLIGAAAVALVGYGAYKIYRHYHDKLGTLETVRMAQYGVDDKSPDKSNKIRDLEALLIPHVKYGGKVPTIDAKAVQLDQMLNIFGISQTQRDKVLRWGTWFVKRFKPVFLTHMEVLHKLDSKVPLCNVDKDLPKKLKMRYLDSIGVPEDTYKVSASPFSESHFLFWSKADPIYNTSAFVDEAFKKARKELQKEGLKNETTKERAAIGMVLAGSKVYDKASQLKPAEQAKLDMNAFHLKPAVAGGLDKAGGALTTVSTIAIMNKSRDVSGLTALQAVRMKAYGLVKMDMDKVHLLLDLEDQVMSHSLVVQGTNHVSFKDKPELYQKLYAARFGVDNSDKTSVSDWLQWFVARFLPTLIQYVTSIKAANKSAMLQNPEMMLKPEQMLTVATGVVGAQSRVDGSLVSVWKVQNSPWPGYVTNDDSSTTKVNIEALKELVHEMELRQQQVKKINENRGAPGKSGKGPVVDRTSLTYGNKPKPAASGTPAQVVALGGQRGYQGTAVQGAGYASSVHGANTGSSDYTPGTAAQIGAGLGGKAATLPVPKGNGWNNIKDMMLGVSQMTGVDPQTLATFAFIESGDRTDAKAGTSSAAGLFQFTGGTWRQMLARYGKQFGIPPNTPSTDPRASALMGAMYIKENAAILHRATGRSPSVAELYMAHFLGPGGAVKILTAPSDTPIRSVVTDKAYKANLSLFARSGDTVGQFENYINGLVTKKGGWNTGGGTNARTLNQAGKAGHQFGGHTTNAAVHNGADIAGTLEGSRAKGFTTQPANVPGFKPSSSVPMPSIQGSVAPIPSVPHAPAFKPATTPTPTSASAPATPAPQVTSPTPMAPIQGMDDDRIQSIAHHQQAIQTVNEVMGRRSNDRISDSTEKMADILSQQLDVQKSMDSSLKSVKESVSVLAKLSAQQLGVLAKTAAPKSDDNGKQVVSNGQVKTAKPMPKLPVDVSRKSSSRLSG